MAAAHGSTHGPGAGYLRAALEADAHHGSKLAAVVRRVRTRPAGVKISMRKATKSHTPHGKDFKRSCHLVDVGPLDSVVSIDPDRLVAVCEGRVTIEQLVDAAAKHGLVPAVIPEIHDFTVAGLINGLGIETSSHRYGGFFDTVTAMEVVLASGEVRHVDLASDKDLFDSLFGSYGTLGIVTAATVGLIPGKPLVRTRYLRFDSLHAYCEAMKAVVGGSHLFIEGFVFSLTDAVLMLGDFVDEVDPSEGELWDPTVRGKEWIHQHARTVSSQLKAGAVVRGDSLAGEMAALGACSAGTDFMGTKHYFFRSERSWLWTLEAFVGFKELTDTEWGRKMVEDRAAGDYAKMDAVFGFAGGSANNPSWSSDDLERVFVQQDTIWHVSNLEKGCRWVAEHIGVWPLWHCPCRVERRAGPFTSVPAAKLALNSFLEPPAYVVDMGIYGEATAPDFRVRRDMRKLQALMDAPTTFGNVYLSPEEFESAFDLTVYRRLRRELGAEDAFPSIETKVVVYDASKPELGRIPLWRLEREGLLVPLKRAAAATAVAAVAGIALLVAGSRHDGGVTGVLRDCADGLRAAAGSVWAAVSGVAAEAPGAESPSSS
ncbi:hypothetical protein FNF31_07461 [Cafeteria roenbergensis]|uniref:Delta(24)-sterol reductase n=1 Tax=Cafeteria roenbergensis TaxID=33653 RepID=A0A5A8C6F8_CAFRO|nr:hypothetical protein FNF31_07461 [Cafeteria roenbergensis]